MSREVCGVRYCMKQPAHLVWCVIDIAPGVGMDVQVSVCSRHFAELRGGIQGIVQVLPSEAANITR